MKNPIINFYRAVKKYGWSEAWSKLRYQYVMLETPESIIQKKILGYLGTIIGLGVSMVIFWWNGKWYLSITLFFSLLIMYAMLKGELKQQQILKDIKKDFEEIKK